MSKVMGIKDKKLVRREVRASIDLHSGSEDTVLVDIVEAIKAIY